MDVLRNELIYFNNIKSKFVLEFSYEDFHYIEQVRAELSSGTLPLLTDLLCSGLESEAGEDKVWRPGLGTLHYQVTSQNSGLNTTKHSTLLKVDIIKLLEKLLDFFF